MTLTSSPPKVLPADQAATYANWFASLSDATRVRLVHAVATNPQGIMVGPLGELLGISQSTCSHHVRKLAEVGFVRVRKEGTATIVTINASCCVGLPHAADAVMGLLSLGSAVPSDIPPEVTLRALTKDDWPDVRRIYAEGIATGDATFETSVPSRATLDAKWLPEQRWIAESGGTLAGWTSCSPVSSRDCYAGVAETSVYVDERFRGRGIGRALMYKQVTEADKAGLWTLQTSIFPENKAGLALHHAAGYRTLGVRERIAKHHGVWRDTVFLERRSAAA
ncbi:MAG: GNAT family N-acetyltransferase [Kibdelosporangium sp.]